MDYVFAYVCRYWNFYWNNRFLFVLFLLYARTFPVIAQAEVKTILKATGDSYIRQREVNKDTHHE